MVVRMIVIAGITEQPMLGHSQQDAAYSRVTALVLPIEMSNVEATIVLISLHLQARP